VPRIRYIFSALLACASISTASIPVSAQALLPYAPEFNSEQLQQQGLFLLQEAVQLIRFQQYDLAMPRAKLASQLAPDRFETWFILGTLEVQQKNYDEGISALKQAQSLSPKDVGVLFTLGNAYFQKGDYQNAIANLQAGLKIEPKTPEALFDLGNTYLKLKQFPEAISHYEKAFAIDKKFLPALINIGLVKYEQGDVKGAIASWQKVVKVHDSLKADEQQPEFKAEPQLAIAIATFVQGQKTQGIKMGEGALSLDGRYGDINYLRDNLWGSRLLTDAQAFLAVPQMQAAIARFSETSAEAEMEMTP
jgi:tetratricopeptide (TPR) repeat protein